MGPSKFKIKYCLSKVILGQILKDSTTWHKRRVKKTQVQARLLQGTIKTRSRKSQAGEGCEFYRHSLLRELNKPTLLLSLAEFLPH